jgi:hypothetical protein
MYPLILTLHSILRWIVLILAVVAFVRALIGWLGKQEWTALDDRLGVLLSGSMDLQVLLGFFLYLFLSPITTSAFRNFGAAMGNSAQRFWMVEHLFLMVVALILTHVGRASSKRAEGVRGKHKRAAIFFGLALLAILIAIPWPFLPYGRPLIPLGQ